MSSAEADRLEANCDNYNVYDGKYNPLNKNAQQHWCLYPNCVPDTYPGHICL